MTHLAQAIEFANKFSPEPLSCTEEEILPSMNLPVEELDTFHILVRAKYDELGGKLDGSP